MYRIRIFSSFGKSENCKDIYERLCESHLMENYGPNKEIYITNNDDFTHVIILNTAMPYISHIPKENVIGFAFEPIQFLGLTEEFVRYAQKQIGKYYIGDKADLPYPFVERFSHMWHNAPLKHTPVKNKAISMMVSEKNAQSGHKYRHDLISKILETSLPIDIYGRGCRYYEYLGDERIKGEFGELEPYESYDFHICIENFETNHYFSEKITNSLMASTTPIYLGCRHIDEYFPDNVIRLSGNVNDDMELLKNIVENPSKYKKKIDLEIIKNRIYLLRNLKTLF
uniref:Fucosyltransferase C-terminal domain-containing protein n=1 Tax=viral metagenome TaxID=1070528 RepID=A0A6C0JFT8_9ZZZZ